MESVANQKIAELQTAISLYSEVQEMVGRVKPFDFVRKYKDLTGEAGMPVQARIAVVPDVTALIALGKALRAARPYVIDEKLSELISGILEAQELEQSIALQLLENQCTALEDASLYLAISCLVADNNGATVKMAEAPKPTISSFKSSFYAFEKEFRARVQEIKRSALPDKRFLVKDHSGNGYKNLELTAKDQYEARAIAVQQWTGRTPIENMVLMRSVSMEELPAQ